MSLSGVTLVITGELRADGDLTIEGTVNGPVRCENAAVVIAATGRISGDVIARDITVHGHVEGQLVATDVVDLRPGAVVTGQVLAPRFILSEDAVFHGRVEPQHLEAALRVARFQQRKRDSA